MRRPRIIARRVANLRRAIGAEVARLRQDAGLTVAALAREAGIDPGYAWRVEHGQVEPSLTTLAALGDALGADLAVRLYPNTGPRIHDRHQAAITQAILAIAHPRWTPTDEVKVVHPVRGWVDLALHDQARNHIVATEVESVLRRLEQLLRWHQDKVAALPSSELWPFASATGTPTVSRLLVVRSTTTNREVARQYEALMRAAYPTRTVDVREALTGTKAWPGHGILWADVRGGMATILHGPPRGVGLGR
jgi:transcriptional regulator with XRE-family HTH domain